MYTAIGYDSWAPGSVWVNWSDKPRDRFKLIEVYREA